MLYVSVEYKKVSDGQFYVMIIAIDFSSYAGAYSASIGSIWDIISEDCIKNYLLRNAPEVGTVYYIEEIPEDEASECPTSYTIKLNNKGDW